MIDKVVEMLDLGEVYAYHCGLMSGRKIWDGLKERADFILSAAETFRPNL